MSSMRFQETLFTLSTFTYCNTIIVPCKLYGKRNTGFITATASATRCLKYSKMDVFTNSLAIDEVGKRVHQAARRQVQRDVVTNNYSASSTLLTSTTSSI